MLKLTKQAEGTSVPSLVSNFLETKGGKNASPEDERMISDIAYSIYVGKPAFVAPVRVNNSNRCFDSGASDTVRIGRFSCLCSKVLTASSDDIYGINFSLPHGYPP
jgi:hypothetical protein